MSIRTAFSSLLTVTVVVLLAPTVADAAAGGQVALRPAAGAAGTSVALEGAGFPASRPVLVGVAGRRAHAVRASRRGTFSARLTVPARGGPAVALVSRSGRTRVVSRFVVTAAGGLRPVVEVASSRGRVRATPAALVPGGALVLRGADFARGRRLVVSWIGARRTVTTDRAGRFTATLPVPGAQAAGLWPALVVGAGIRLSFRLDVLAPAAAAPPPAGSTVVPPGAGAGTPVTAAGVTAPPVPVAGPPVSTGLPGVGGVAQIGQTLTADRGTWGGATPTAFAFAWRRCDAGGAACTAVARATSATYAVVAADAGHTLRVAVTATNRSGSATATSAATSVVPTPPPPPATGLVALWHMDETSGAVMQDAIGGHHGTLSGVALGQPGFAGTAFGFSSSTATVPSAGALNPGSANITITIHLKSTSVPATPDWDLIRKGTFTSVGGEYKVEYQPSGQASCGFIGSGGASRELIAGPALNDGAWHTVTCTKTASAIRLVVDGQTFSMAGAVGSISNTADLVIGSHPGAEFFRGSLDEASVQVG